MKHCSIILDQGRNGRWEDGVKLSPSVQPKFLEFINALLATRSTSRFCIQLSNNFLQKKFSFNIYQIVQAKLTLSVTPSDLCKLTCLSDNNAGLSTLRSNVKSFILDSLIVQQLKPKQSYFCIPRRREELPMLFH